MTDVRCTRCAGPLLRVKWARINGLPYCSKACYEATMRDKKLTR
jgi:hypothetical protein